MMLIVFKNRFGWAYWLVFLSPYPFNRMMESFHTQPESFGLCQRENTRVFSSPTGFSTWICTHSHRHTFTGNFIDRIHILYFILFLVTVDIRSFVAGLMMAKMKFWIHLTIKRCTHTHQHLSTCSVGFVCKFVPHYLNIIESKILASNQSSWNSQSAIISLWIANIEKNGIFSMSVLCYMNGFDGWILFICDSLSLWLI